MGRQHRRIRATGQYDRGSPVEIVERKGIGTPTALCDAYASVSAASMCAGREENLGGALHHNFDKVQLVAGEVDVHFGGGQLIKPSAFRLPAGHCRTSMASCAMDAIAIEAAKSQSVRRCAILEP